jgi:hypothetical protein
MAHASSPVNSFERQIVVPVSDGEAVEEVTIERNFKNSQILGEIRELCMH